MIDITTEHGYIGPFWWINSQPSEKHWFADRYWELWGTFGIGRKNLRIALEPCYEQKLEAANG